MNFKEYQELTETTAKYPRVGITGICYTTLGLASEAGEVAGKVKKAIRDNNGIINDEIKKAIELELGDTLWYVSQTCKELHLDLEKVAINNIEKLKERMKNNTINGSGDNR